jgi:pectate lyase
MGYATVTDDEGTPYTITGGLGGDTIIISSLAELTQEKSKISSNDPYIIQITSRITTADNKSIYFDVGSNKTFLGEAGKDYGFKNINVKITGSNVIVKNLHFGDVIALDYFGGSGNDALSIKGGEHVWIDHCEFSSHLEPYDNDGNKLEYEEKYNVDLEGENTTPAEKFKKDFYDGLLDVTNGSRFVSISNCYFHDHWKACLCGGSNDKAESQPLEQVERLTFYNNYFENVHSRMPLFRFGKAHIFSSYYKGIAGGSTSTGIEVRAESQVYVDNCYFEDIRSDRTVGCWNSSSGLGAGTYRTVSNYGMGNENHTSYVPPYEWTAASAADSKANLPDSAGIEKE